MPEKKPERGHSGWVTVIAGIIAFFCFFYLFYHIKTFTDDLFVNLLVLVVGIVSVLVALTEGGSFLSGED